MLLLIDLTRFLQPGCFCLALLVQLQLLPLMYFFEIQDMVFAITSLKSPTKTLTLTIISLVVKAIQDQHPLTSPHSTLLPSKPPLYYAGLKLVSTQKSSGKP